MAKKVEETEIVSKNEPILPVHTVFGQEDLNKLVEKINELIARVNSVL